MGNQTLVFLHMVRGRGTFKGYFNINEKFNDIILKLNKSSSCNFLPYVFCECNVVMVNSVSNQPQDVSSIVTEFFMADSPPFLASLDVDVDIM